MRFALERGQASWYDVVMVSLTNSGGGAGRADTRYRTPHLQDGRPAIQGG